MVPLSYQIAHDDLTTERETYQTSRAGLDTMYQDLQTRMAEETQMRLVGKQRFGGKTGMLHQAQN